MIVEALKDPYLHDSKRLSLLLRARKICLSQKNTVEGSKPKKKATLSKKRRASSSASSKSSANVALSYGIEEFPMMDITEAPQVRVVHIIGDCLYRFCYLCSSIIIPILLLHDFVRSCSYTSQVIDSTLDPSTSPKTLQNLTIVPLHLWMIEISISLPLFLL